MEFEITATLTEAQEPGFCIMVSKYLGRQTRWLIITDYQFITKFVVQDVKIMLDVQLEGKYVTTYKFTYRDQIDNPSEYYYKLAMFLQGYMTDMFEIFCGSNLLAPINIMVYPDPTFEDNNNDEQP